MLYALFGNIV